ncbi:myocardial zonula adherens protein-like [Trachemys scripta elegans]|uniref:myocardial zonula adherens protein-like n=1 Tax=Trachemys scripta elegans TaxID=31138 RepID=UPI001555C28C|nr:myocardial zonula adherens protein-like [Trachemys scripta elegans]
MLRYSSALTVTATVPRPPAGESGPGKKRMNVCRLRLTVPPDEGSFSEQGANKLERTKKQPYHVPNGMSTGKFSDGMVYGVVHRTDNNHKKEMVVYGWSAHQLKEEMNYIKDVRATLEKVRKKMYGEYGEMKRKIQQLTNELTITNVEKESLESHMQVQAAALDSFSEMNSSLTSASIELQKTLVDVSLENTDIRDQIRNLKHTHERSMEKLKEKQKQLETAQVENQLLKLKVECSQEANADVMREMTRRLYSQYEEKLQQEEQKHIAERETLIAETNRLLKAIEEANKKMQITETSIQEKDKRIGELDRFIQRMEEERHQLQKQLVQHEVQISGAKSQTHSDRRRSQHLEEVAAGLRERIKHLDDMVHCQQKKVKHMVEEIEILKKKIMQKELFIMQLLEKISFLECENKELQDRLDYLMETHPRTNVETREIGVGCDLPSRTFIYRLPDKGKKISDFVEKLKLAIAQQEELRRTTDQLSVVRLEFQTKQEEINTNKQRVALSEHKSTNKVFSSIYENSATNVNKASKTVLQDKEAECTEKRDTHTASAKGYKKRDQIESMIEDHAKSQESKSNLNSSSISLMKIDQQIPKYSSLGETESAVDASGNSGDMLVDAFERVAVGDGNNSERKSEKEQNIAKFKNNPFGSLPTVTPKKPHYIEVLESRAKNPRSKNKFKTNVLPAEWSGSSHDSSPSRSPRRLGSSISEEERCLRDKKHLDDITAARLPPLHHAPTQLLSIEESIAIQMQQKEIYEETQAKLAAQKLAEMLNIKMVRYEPEGETSMKYREVRDEEDYHSLED